MKGNKNAEKYTKEEALKLFQDSIGLALTKIEGKEEYKYDFIGEIARDLKTYHHIYIHLIARFPELDELFTELKQTLEANCYYNAKKGHIKEATGIVNLKSNHHWTDRQQIDGNFKGDVHISRKRWVK
jgi:tryptophanase